MMWSRDGPTDYVRQNISHVSKCFAGVFGLLLADWLQPAAGAPNEIEDLYLQV